MNDLSTRVYFRSPILSRLFSIRFVVVVVCLTRAIKNGNRLLSLIIPRQHAVEKPLLVVLSGAKSLRVNFCLRSHFRDFLSCFFCDSTRMDQEFMYFFFKGFLFCHFVVYLLGNKLDGKEETIMCLDLVLVVLSLQQSLNQWMNVHF